MRISDWSSDVCSSDLLRNFGHDISRTWRFRGGLDDDRAASDQRRGEFVRDEVDRRVPWNDRGDHSPRLADEKPEFANRGRRVWLFERERVGEAGIIIEDRQSKCLKSRH